MKVAVVGSGVSGLGATWLLNEHSDHEVHLYESDYRPGGHANTVHFVPKGKTWADGVDVDTGFIVFNPSTYPNFLRFLQLFPSNRSIRPSNLWLPWFLRRRKLDIDDATDTGIHIDKTEMTFSISRDSGAFEWAGKNLATVFCQPHRLVDPQMWRMIYDVLRFNACSRRVLLSTPSENEKEMTIGQYLEKENYSAAFRNNYLIPMTAAIWSTPPDNCFLDFPAQTLIQFMFNHNLLQITGKPSWLTIRGGSRQYVNKILSKLPSDRLHLSTPITSVRVHDVVDGEKPQVTLTTAGGEELLYDHVILACHSDTTLEILRAGGITDAEERILSQFEWNRNKVILHSDERLMPRSKIAWSCWNYLSFTKPAPSNKSNGGYGYGSDTDSDLYSSQEKSSEKTTSMEVNEVSLTYGMNDLQHIPESKYGPVLVTLNPPYEPDEDKIGGRWKYDHPVLDAKAVRAQNEMYKIQNKRSISYAGAYLKYGFHEDGFTSGLLAACSLDDNSLPASTAFTDALSGMTIPMRRVTVHPPFEIQHADHHVRLRKEGVASVGKIYVYGAKFFDWLEVSGVREIVGVVGALVLSVLGYLFGIHRL